MRYASELGDGSRRILALSAKMGIPALDHERGLVARIEAGDKEALDELVLRNVRLIVSLMRGFHGVLAEDLFQAGLLGMYLGTKKIKLEKWDETLARMLRDHAKTPRPYATFAMKCANRKMNEEAMYQGSSVYRGKVDARRRSRTTNSTRESWESTTRVFSIEAINGVTNIKGGAFGKEEGSAIISKERGLGLMAQIESATKQDPYDTESDLDFSRAVLVMGDVCNAREEDIIRNYYGLNGEAENLDILSKKYGLCRERIRQIREEGLAKIRKNMDKVLV